MAREDLKPYHVVERVDCRYSITEYADERDAKEAQRVAGHEAGVDINEVIWGTSGRTVSGIHLVTKKKGLNPRLVALIVYVVLLAVPIFLAYHFLAKPD